MQARTPNGNGWKVSSIQISVTTSADITSVQARGTADERSTGLGLAIVRELVQLHGGAIEVTSEVRRGGTFSIHLPG